MWPANGENQEENAATPPQLDSKLTDKLWASYWRCKIPLYDNYTQR